MQQPPIQPPPDHNDGKSDDDAVRMKKTLANDEGVS